MKLEIERSAVGDADGEGHGEGDDLKEVKEEKEAKGKGEDDGECCACSSHSRLFCWGSLRLWCLSWSTQCLPSHSPLSPLPSHFSPLTSPLSLLPSHFSFLLSNPSISSHLDLALLTTTPIPPATSTPPPPPPKRYTFLLKDEILPLRTDGREQSTISYEYEFQPEPASASTNDTAATTITIPFSSLRATYRGKDTPDARAINLKKVRRISFMMRRYVVSHLISSVHLLSFIIPMLVV